jgi:hypothetical protein
VEQKLCVECVQEPEQVALDKNRLRGSGNALNESRSAVIDRLSKNINSSSSSNSRAEKPYSLFNRISDYRIRNTRELVKRAIKRGSEDRAEISAAIYQNRLSQPIFHKIQENLKTATERLSI